MNLDLRILTGSYDRSNEKDVVVELFCRSKDRRSVVVRYHGFQPYFHLVSPPASIVAELTNDKEIIDIKDAKLWHNGKVQECKKVFLNSPWKVPEYREKMQRYCEVLAADIPFHHRFIYDMNLSSCINVEGEDVTPQLKDKYSADVVLKADKIKNISDFKPDLKILSFDIENSMKDSKIFTIGFVVRDNTSLKTHHIEGTNSSIIQDFVKFIKTEDPDVVAGYNIDGYDLPYLLERAKETNQELLIARDSSKPQRIMGRFWRVHGRIITDVWWNVKREIRPKQETLNAVAKQILGEEKLDVDRLKIDEEWKKDKEKVIKYCIKDAELALKILEKINILPRYMDLSTVSMLPLDDTINSGTSTLIDSILIREADRDGIGVPMTKTHEEEERIEGGYVHSITPGLYHWVCVLDFKSMYPSIMIKYNICFTTLSKSGAIQSPTGARFLDQSVKKGLVPKILENLMRQRDDVKIKLKKATGEELSYYEGLQYAIKILMNSFYGVFASSFYRFTNTEIGASITSFARETIKNIINDLQSKNIKVVYGDTDSIFFESPHPNYDKTVEYGKKVAEKFSKQENLTFEFQNILEPFFSHGAKKRYVGKILYPPDQKDTLIIRGYETRRTDSFDLQSEALMRIFELILNNDLSGAKKEAERIIDFVRKGEVNTEKLVISRTVKEKKYYKNPRSMPNIQAAEKLKKLGEETFPSMKVSWIVTNDRKSPQEVEPFIQGREFDFKPDYGYYARRIAETLSRVTEVFGLDESRLLSGKKQATLFEELQSAKKSKKRTLDEFF